MKKFIRGLGPIFIFFLTPVSYASPPPQARPNVVDFSYRGDYFFTSSNLSSDFGDIDDLPTGQKYSNFTNTFEAGYSPNRDFRFSAGAVAAYAQSDGAGQSRSNSQLNGLLLTSQYHLRLGRFRMTPDARILFSLEKADHNTDDVMTSEQASIYEVGSWFHYPIWRLRPYAHLAFRFMDDDRASSLAWALGTAWPFRSWWLSGEVHGTTTVSDDAHADFPAYREVVTNRVNGGSLRYYAVNPEVIEAEILAGLSFPRGISISGGLAQTITGKNAAYGTTAVVKVNFDWRLAGAKAAANTRPPDQFEPVLEDYDPNLFSND